MMGRTEAFGHRQRGGETGDVPTVSLEYTHARSEQDKEEEKGLPIAVVKDRARACRSMRCRW